MARTGRLSFTKQFEDPAYGEPKAVHTPAQHGAVTVEQLRALIALPEIRLRGLADAGYAGEQQPAVARGDERGVQDHGVPLQQQGLEGNVGEAVGRLGEKAPVGLQIFDGLAPVWLQMADSIGPVALAPVVEDAKKAVLRSEDGRSSRPRTSGRACTGSSETVRGASPGAQRKGWKPRVTSGRNGISRRISQPAMEKEIDSTGG